MGECLLKLLIVASLLTEVKKWVIVCINGDPKLKEKTGSEFAPHNPKSPCLPSTHLAIII